MNVRVIGGSSYRGFELSGVRVIGGSSYRGFELSGVRVIGIILYLDFIALKFAPRGISTQSFGDKSGKNVHRGICL